MKIKTIHPFQWIVEPLNGHSSFEQRKMFGGEVLYLHGRQMFFLIAKEEPWNGLLVCTSVEHHASLKKEYPALAPHSVLGKWLYVSQSNANFEDLARQLATRVLQADSRLGVELERRRKRRSTKRAGMRTRR